MFNLGQKVWCIVYGEGTVKQIDQQGLLKVEFLDKNVKLYTLTGKWYETGNQVLFPLPSQDRSRV